MPINFSVMSNYHITIDEGWHIQSLYAPWKRGRCSYNVSLHHLLTPRSKDGPQQGQVAQKKLKTNKKRRTQYKIVPACRHVVSVQYRMVALSNLISDPFSPLLVLLYVSKELHSSSSIHQPAVYLVQVAPILQPAVHLVQVAHRQYNWHQVAPQPGLSGVEVEEY